MRRPLDDTVLRLVRGLGVADLDRELDLQELHRLVPINVCRALDERWLFVEDRCEGDNRPDGAVLADARLRHDARAMPLILVDRGIRVAQLFTRVQVIHLGGPRLPVDRLVVEDSILIRLTGQRLSPISAIVDGSDGSVLDRDGQMSVL